MTPRALCVTLCPVSGRSRLTMGKPITEKQTKTLEKLKALPAETLSAKQRAKLEKLKKKRPADDSISAPAKRVKQDGEAKEAERTDQTATSKCTDEGRWGTYGEWIYPKDQERVCSTCKESFTFTGMEQAWYAKKELYAPARCPTCIAAKNDVRAEKQKTGKSGEGRCFNCGGTGHLSAECPMPRAQPAINGARKACYVCGSDAHLSRNCPKAAKKAKSGCFICGSTAHLSRECPQRPPPVCYNCGTVGHASKACEQPTRPEGSLCLAFAKGQCNSKKCKFVH